MAPTLPIEFIGQKQSKNCWIAPQPMGKSRKYSKGISSGFVPDYRHAVETVGESEGFGSSGRVDTEMTASEDSYAPKRKCMSSNFDGHDSFSVPMQVLSLSKMSRSERKNLEWRLKNELEQVRILQRKVVSFGSNAVVLSPSSDIRSCSDGLKRPPLEGLHRSFEVSHPQSKKRVPPPGRNGARNKKSTHGRSELAKLAEPAVNTDAMLMKQCGTLLNRLMSHTFGWVFNTPVDVVKLKLPDYFTVIKYPMDLGTVKDKLASGAYSSPLGFAADVRLTFANSLKYNPPGNDVHVMADTLSKFFEVRWKAIEKKLSVINDVRPVAPRASVPEELETYVDSVPAKKKKIEQTDSKVKLEPAKQVMTTKEKQILSTELEALLGELPERIIDFLKEHSENPDENAEDEIEIDIDTLSDDTLLKLRKLLDDYLLEKQKSQSKAEPCEMELPNEYGFSNSSLQPCRGNEPIDEDIDIVGGNDPPVSSYPSVKIEKDAANKNSKCSSSSSSSSESGSSSDDSDSGSSGSESDAPRAPVPCDLNKETLGSAETLDQKKSDLVDPDIGNQCANELVKIESDSQGEPLTVETDLQDGENAPPDNRQVSPDKLYRAAILRNRFADTILKAREKALEKGEKRDPEKLRLEREELERQQKEEKARLQAEAKAAEEAQKKAAAEAAAEAKRQRELEREAARLALQQMEKTVDINENSQFMEDLEMLRTTAHDEELPSFIEETSADFMLQGSKALEQLGLYMKKDDEEEEEVEAPESVSELVKDVEEGVSELVKDVEEGEVD
ncbi:transcription factor GTE10-like [Mercurialis annua]|uniref:transcription factor GTE10-like n=1 Tax=Mercurialis annua TaxID=3986 RepID=UPI00215FC6F1|nr:transcription factor GTE10-like [Mercurialis annua]